jgi:hypothetical protein
MVIDLDLTPELFSALGGHVAGPVGALSPWDSDAPEPSAEDRARLRAEGVVDANGHVASDLQRVLESLARSSGSTTLSASGVAGSLAHVSYGDGPGRTIGVTATTKGTVRLQEPSPAAEMAAIIGQVVGPGSEWGIEPLDLALSEAFTLAAIVDATRRHWFAQLAASGAGDVAPLRRPEIRDLLARPVEGSFWMVQAVAKAAGAEAETAVADLDADLGRLVAARIAETTPDTVALAGRWAELALRFLTPGSVIELENLRAGSGASPLSRAGFVILRGASDELLSLERVGDRVHVGTIGAATLLGYIEVLLRAPSGERGEPFVATHIVLPGGPAPAWPVPNTASPELTGVASGTGLRLLGESGGWAEVESAAGWQGWLDRRWLDDLPALGSRS